MNKILKYGVFPIVSFLFLLVVTVLLLPVLINVQKYVPEIEKSISKAAGRPFTIGPDVAVSFFPRLSLTFSNLKLGNPPGFSSEALVKIDSFEARVKLLPLLKKEIRISRFVVGGLEVNLEKNSSGRENWKMPRSMVLSWLDILQDKVSCSLLAVTDGTVNWIDRTSHVRHSVEQLMLLLTNMQTDPHAALEFKASYDGKPVALEGKVGSLRQNQSGQSFPLDIGFRFMEIVQGQVQGKIEKLGAAPVYDIALNLSPFSPRKLFAALEIPFPVEAVDPTTFQTMGLDLAVKGRQDGLTVEHGTARLDDTTMAFSGEVKNVKKPEVGFSLAIDRLDLDRYFSSEDRQELESARPEPGNSAMGLVYGLARSSSFAGTLNVQSLKMYGATGSNVQSAIGAKDGIITLDHATMQLCGGQLQADLAADLTGGMPRMRVGVQAQGIEAETMLRQIAGRDNLTGTLAGDLRLAFSGNTPVERQASLTGEASFACFDGALLGIDLGRAERRQMAEARPADERKRMRTDFSELKGALTIDGGQLTLRDATLTSPAVALALGGGVNIPGRAWKLQVSPQNAELKPARGRSSLPLTIAGTFEEADDQLDNRQSAVGTAAGAATVNVNVESLVEEKIPPPIEDDVKALVGKPLIDPAIVAQRFHLQRETIRQSEKKKQLRLGSGKIRINPLLEAIAR